jgi:ankyrin repeat protein
MRLLWQGANVDTEEGKHGVHPLHDAICNGNFEIVTLLADNGADLNATTTLGDTPIMLAMEYAQSDICLFLVERGVDPNQEDKYKRTPLSQFASGAKPSLSRETRMLFVDAFKAGREEYLTKHSSRRR